VNSKTKKERALELYKKNRKEVFKPLEKHLRKVIKALKKHDLNIPLSHIAWRDIHGDFSAPHLKAFRSDLFIFLGAVQDYKKSLWVFHKETSALFEKEMKEEGSYPSQQKEFKSLKIELPNALLEDPKIWIISYDSYLPRIRETSSKKDPNPSIGKEMFAKLKNGMSSKTREVKGLQKKAVKVTKDFNDDLKRASKKRYGKWGEWRSDGNGSKTKGAGAKVNAVK